MKEGVGTVATAAGKGALSGGAGGAIVGGAIVVASGLAPGERIVAAGVSALREGMLVRPLESR